jgi:uncharacterized protein
MDINKEVSGRYLEYPQYNRHLVEIKPSLIPNAGYGLFAKTDIPKGTHIDMYHGKRMNRKEYKACTTNWSYIMEINRDLYVDGFESKCFVAFTNDARGLTRVPGLRNNCFFELNEAGDNMLMTTSRKIKAGEELFVFYGDSYWRQVAYNIKHDLQPTDSQ